MIVKPFEKSLDIIQLEALVDRLPDDHPQKEKVLSDFYRSIAGHNGEKEAFFQLQFLPKNDYYIFHNLRLFDSIKNYFQMDFVILTAAYILILEIKNHKGSVYFNEIEQLIHVKENKKEEVYSNPISQIDRHSFQLQNFLYKHGYFNLPIFACVVFTTSTRLIKTETIQPKSLKKISSVQNLVKQIIELSREHYAPVLNKSKLNHLSTLLLNSHIPVHRNLLEKYNLHSNDLLKGVQCSNCLKLPMTKMNHNWKCDYCGAQGKENHIHALNDYFLLISDTIGNKELRQFLLLDSRQTAYRLLKKAGYQSHGNGSKTRYLLKYINVEYTSQKIS